MKILRYLMLFSAAAILGVGCGKKAELSRAPETVQKWWRAVTLGDRAAADGLVAEGAKEAGAVRIDEYARVKKSAAAGDELAVRMLKRLEGVRFGEIRGGSDRATVRMVMSDGKPFMNVYLELRGDRWAIVDFD